MSSAMTDSQMSERPQTKGRAKPHSHVPLYEFISAQQHIEQELLSKKLGSVKLHRSNMTFEWKEGENRALADTSKTTALRESFIQGVFRYDMAHRMSGCLSKKIFETSLYEPDGSQKKVNMKEVERLNFDAEFPILTIKSGTRVEMQSGQHRMALLQELMPLSKDHWWIVTIYDESNPKVRCELILTRSNP
jgi:hypothetical protein